MTAGIKIIFNGDLETLYQQLSKLTTSQRSATQVAVEFSLIADYQTFTAIKALFSGVSGVRLIYDESVP